MALTNLQYDRIHKYYETLRDENRYESDRRSRQAHLVLPELSQIDDAISSIAMQRVMAKFDASVQEPTTSIRELTEKRRELLLSAGYSADYLDPIYTCKDCRDTGYIESFDEEGNPLPAKKCHCMKNLEIQLLYENSNMSNSLLECSFDRFVNSHRKGEDLEALNRAYTKAKEFISDFDTAHPNLFLYGTVGTGKSFLSGCIANELIQKGRSVVYFSAIHFFDLLAEYHFQASSKEMLYNFMKDLYYYDLVIIDDLGTELTNSFVNSQLFDFINERLLGKKSTIISSNVTFEELRDRYTDRTFSRITSNYQLCKLTGADFRLLKPGIRQ